VVNKDESISARCLVNKVVHNNPELENTLYCLENMVLNSVCRQPVSGNAFVDFRDGGVNRVSENHGEPPWKMTPEQKQPPWNPDLNANYCACFWTVMSGEFLRVCPDTGFQRRS